VSILPKDLASRVRRLQVHNESVERVLAGQRTAVNLPGIETHQIERGDLLCLPHTLRSTTALEATLSLLPDAPKTLANRTRVRFHLGTAETLARVILLDKEELNPGEGAYVHLRLETPTAALPQDRYVLRSYSPTFTIGGGVILDPCPPLRRRRRPEVVTHLKVLEQGAPSDRLLQWLKSAGPSPLSLSILLSLSDLDPEPLRRELEELLQAGKIVCLKGRDEEVYLHRETYEDLRETMLSQLKAFHAQHPLREGISKEELKSRMAAKISPLLFAHLLSDLIEAGQVSQERDRVRLAEHRPQLSPTEAILKGRLETLYRNAGFQPPTLEVALKEGGEDRKVTQAVFFRLVEERILIKIKEDLYLHRDSYEQAKALLLAHLAEHPSISVPTFKDLLGVTRKHAIPYLEHFDQIKLTRRQGDERVLYGK